MKAQDIQFKDAIYKNGKHTGHHTPVKPIIIHLDGGLVQSVYIDGIRNIDCPVIVVDSDTEGCDGLELFHGEYAIHTECIEPIKNLDQDVIESVQQYLEGDGTPPKFKNFYHCLDDGSKWDDIWTATCNDRCPKCNKEITPSRSVGVPPADQWKPEKKK